MTNILLSILYYFIEFLEQVNMKIADSVWILYPELCRMKFDHLIINKIVFIGMKV